MRVLLDTTYAQRAPLSGTGIYVRRIAEALEHVAGVELYRAADDRRRAPAGGGLGSVRNLAGDALWSGLRLPRRGVRERLQVVHHTMPGVILPHRLPQVVTVLDLAFERFPDMFDPRFRAYAHHVHRAAARRAAAVVCISQATADDAVALWGVDPARTVVAPLGPGQALPAPPAPPGPPTHFLYIGDAEPRKDLPTLLTAYARYREQAGERPLELVLAGDAAAAAPGVRCERRPAAARVSVLLAGAAALVHASRHEGFGMTVLEAMAAGTPVIAARSPGAVEVGGAAAVLVPAGDAAAFARAMLELAADPGRRAELARSGRERAKAFSWDRCAQAHLAAYSLALLR